MSTGETILNLLFPPKCAFCGALLDLDPPPGYTGTLPSEHPGGPPTAHKSDGLCPACRASLPLASGSGQLRMVDGFPCAVALRYEAMVRQGVHALKFHDHPQRARVFARYLAQAAAEQFPGGFDTVTFVPVSLWRNYRRGYDQARLLAEEAGKLWGVSAVPILRKVRNNRPQSSVKSSALRRANVLDAYIVPHPEEARGRRFLLIDDVVTTGSTMAACARCLMDAGAESVVCAALAGAEK